LTDDRGRQVVDRLGPKASAVPGCRFAAVFPRERLIKRSICAWFRRGWRDPIVAAMWPSKFDSAVLTLVVLGLLALSLLTVWQMFRQMVDLIGSTLASV
jgi:hypothetical protein